tara:strand:- start:225 stop:413 length:189 start_codon:yes stop_codon:yes gene_type:complete
MAKKAKSNPKGGLKMSPYYGVAPKKKKRFGGMKNSLLKMVPYGVSSYRGTAPVFGSVDSFVQ